MASGVQSVTSPFFHGAPVLHRRPRRAVFLPDAFLTFRAMDDLVSARAALARAIDDVQAAITRVRSAQQVDWASVLASRYREELYQAIQELMRFRDRLEATRGGLA